MLRTKEVDKNAASRFSRGCVSVHFVSSHCISLVGFDLLVHRLMNEARTEVVIPQEASDIDYGIPRTLKERQCKIPQQLFQEDAT
jgi:hypothetical protein